jgi:hypothetical protein
MLSLVLILYFSLINNVNSINFINNFKQQFKTANVGKELGLNFESDIKSIAFHAGYRCAISPDETDLQSVYFTYKKNAGELDAFVTGEKHSFDKFRDSFFTTHISSPPSSEKHTAIIEAKLNYRLLEDWIKNNNEGSKYLFFNPRADQLYTKILVLNGGIESENFVKNLSSEEDIERFKEVKAALLKANINVFYKVWASGESFSDLGDKVEFLTEQMLVFEF